MVKKTERLPQARLTALELRVVKSAAELSGLTMTDYLVGCALDRAALLGVKIRHPVHPGQMTML